MPREKKLKTPVTYDSIGLTRLEATVRFMRQLGVASYSDGGLQIVLGPPPAAQRPWPEQVVPDSSIPAVVVEPDEEDIDDKSDCPCGAGPDERTGDQCWQCGRSAATRIEQRSKVVGA